MLCTSALVKRPLATELNYACAEVFGKLAKYAPLKTGQLIEQVAEKRVTEL
jgi:hypothetical protein